MEAFVGLTQLAQRRFEEGLVLVFLSGTQGCQSVEADIDAYGVRTWVRWIRLRLWKFDGYACKPPIGGFGDPYACHLPLEAKGLRHIHPSKFGDPHTMIPQLELIIGKIERGARAFFAFELGPTFLCPVLQSFKERSKRLSQIEKGLVGGVFRHLPSPGELFAPHLIELLLEFQCRRFLACF